MRQLGVVRMKSWNSFTCYSRGFPSVHTVCAPTQSGQQSLKTLAGAVKPPGVLATDFQVRASPLAVTLALQGWKVDPRPFRMCCDPSIPPFFTTPVFVSETLIDF